MTDNRSAPPATSRRGFLQMAGAGLAAGGFGALGAATSTTRAADPQEPSRLRLWLPSDSHVGHPSESDTGKHMRTAVEDVNAMDRPIDLAVHMGDLLEDEYQLFEPFIRAMNALEAPWTYVLGNHDFDRESERAVLPIHYSGRTMLGIRFIFLSTETANAVNRDLVIGEQQERWLWSELANHADKPIFMLTHQPHDEFNRWPALREVLGDYRIKAWFSGHKHRWNVREDSGHGFVQVNMHSIGGVREDDLSTFMDLQRDGDQVQARLQFRHHERREWIAANDGQDELRFTIDLS